MKLKIRKYYVNWQMFMKLHKEHTVLLKPDTQFQLIASYCRTDQKVFRSYIDQLRSFLTA